MELSLALRDAYGNAIVDLEPGAVRAVATGAHGAVHFQAYEVLLAASSLPRHVSC